MHGGPVRLHPIKATPCFNASLPNFVICRFNIHTDCQIVVLQLLSVADCKPLKSLNQQTWSLIAL